MPIDWTGEEIQLDGLESHQFFGGDARPVVVTLRQEAIAVEETVAASPIPFYLLLHHREGLRTDAIRLRLYAPPRDGSPFDAAIYLGPPASEHWPPVTTSRTDEWTVFDATELGHTDGRTGYVPGAANVRLDFLVAPAASHTVGDLFIEIEATLSERAAVGRRTFEIRRSFTFPIVTA